MTIHEYLKGLSAYPIPLMAIVAVATDRRLTLDEEATVEATRSRACKLATADLFCWLSVAPNVSQGGQSYSFSDEQRKDLRSRALAIYKEFGDSGASRQTSFGYKGSRL